MSYSVDEIYDTVFDNIEFDKNKEEKWRNYEIKY